MKKMLFTITSLALLMFGSQALFAERPGACFVIWLVEGEQKQVKCFDNLTLEECNKVMEQYHFDLLNTRGRSLKQIYNKLLIDGKCKK